MTAQLLDAMLMPRLMQQAQANLFRRRETLAFPSLRNTNTHYLSFCSNDYLGLKQHPRVIAAWQASAVLYGVGSGASALISGYTAAHRDFEIAFAKFVRRERALLFNSGYLANLGVFQALIKSGDTIYADRLNHASLVDAGLLTRAKLRRFRHGDLQHLETLLQQASTGTKWLVTDSIFSMQGSCAPLQQLAALAEQYNAYLIVDDAHGIGLLGARGAGALEQFNLTAAQVPVLICPLGKAFGGAGAIVAGSATLIETLIQFARTYTYSTAIPPALACAALASLKIIEDEPWHRVKLHKLIEYFKHSATERGLNFLPSNTAIQVLLVNDAARAVWLSAQLLTKGFLVSAIRPPSVPSGKARLRITLNAKHTEIQIRQLLDTLQIYHAANH